eukprot:567967-Amphidinium_carterae.2
MKTKKDLSIATRHKDRQAHDIQLLHRYPAAVCDDSCCITAPWYTVFDHNLHGRWTGGRVYQVDEDADKARANPSAKVGTRRQSGDGTDPWSC